MLRSAGKQTKSDHENLGSFSPWSLLPYIGSSFSLDLILEGSIKRFGFAIFSDRRSKSYPRYCQIKEFYDNEQRHLSGYMNMRTLLHARVLTKIRSPYGSQSENRKYTIT